MTILVGKYFLYRATYVSKSGVLWKKNGIPDELGRVHIVRQKLLPRPFPEGVQLGLVPNVDNETIKHIVCLDVLFDLS